MKITRESEFTGIVRTLDIDVTEEQIKDWESGTLIQKAMPNITANEREFIMTGVTQEEWNDLCGEEDEEDNTLCLDDNEEDEEDENNEIEF